MQTHVRTAMAAVTAAVQPDVQSPESKGPPEPKMPVTRVETDVGTAVAAVTPAVQPDVTESAKSMRGSRRSKPSA